MSGVYLAAFDQAKQMIKTLSGEIGFIPSSRLA